MLITNFTYNSFCNLLTSILESSFNISTTKISNINDFNNYIDIEFRKNEFVAILGPSGCGKSTFLRCMNCLEDPDGGSIMFEGEDLADMKVDINEHRQHMVCEVR